jgi:hypothetical protein
MIKLEIYRVKVSSTEPATTIVASDTELSIKGDMGIVDLTQNVMSVKHQGPISLSDDRVEWVRGLCDSYNRGNQGRRFARIVQDT